MRPLRDNRMSFDLTSTDGYLVGRRLAEIVATAKRDPARTVALLAIDPQFDVLEDYSIKYEQIGRSATGFVWGLPDMTVPYVYLIDFSKRPFTGWIGENPSGSPLLKYQCSVPLLGAFLVFMRSDVIQDLMERTRAINNSDMTKEQKAAEHAKITALNRQLMPAERVMARAPVKSRHT